MPNRCLNAFIMSLILINYFFFFVLDLMWNALFYATQSFYLIRDIVETFVEIIENRIPLGPPTNGDNPIATDQGRVI